MKYLLFSAKTGLILFLVSCTSSSDQRKACTTPEGRFINMTVLDQCDSDDISAIPHFCYEMTFKEQGKVLIDNGFEKFSLPYSTTEESCVFKIAKASLYGDMYFRIEADSSISLIDSAWTKLSTATTFRRMVNAAGEDWSFEHYFNECSVAGEYALFHNGNLEPGVVTIMANGQLNGLKPYLGFSLCYAGDCLEETSPPANVMYLIDGNGVRETFVYKRLSGKMAIELYSVAPAIPDVKGERAIGPMVYELRTE